MTKPILFIVPNRTLELHSKIIRITLWAIESDRSYVAMSVSAFVAMLESLSVEDATAELQANYESVCNMGTLSKRERAACHQVFDPILEYITASQPAPQGAATNERRD